jgi:hypothetical protein
MRPPVLALIAFCCTALHASSPDRVPLSHRQIDKRVLEPAAWEGQERAERREETAPPHWWSKRVNPPLEAVHAISYLFPQEGLIELEDGSRWAVAESAWRLLRNMNYGDRVTFQQNRSWFSIYPFRMVVLRTGESIEACAVEGPLLDSPYCRSLIGASLDKTTLELSDGTIWEIDPYSSRSVEIGSWAIQDVIMMGMHDSGWWASQYPVILYNCGADSWIPARRLR